MEESNHDTTDKPGNADVALRGHGAAKAGTMTLKRIIHIPIRKLVLLASAGLAVALIAAGCGSAGSTSSTEAGSSSASQSGTASGEAVNASIEKPAGASTEKPATGNWQKVHVSVGTRTVSVKGPIHLAYFAPGENNSWLLSAIKGAKDTISEIPGATITVFDGNWTPQTQYNQVQTALESGKYNAALIDPVDTQLMCHITTKTAPEHGMLIENITHPLCSRYSKEGEQRWSPGTMGYVDANDTVAELKDYMMWIAKENPGQQEAAVISGPPNDGMTKNLQIAIRQMEASGKYSQFHFVDLITTEFSLTQAQEKLSALLQSHPKLSVVFTPATSDVTRGAYAAIAGAHRTGSVKLYGKGGSEWEANAVKSGEVQAMQPQYPYSNTQIAVLQLDKAFHGEPTERFVPNYGVTYDAEDQKLGFQLFTQGNIGSYKPQY